MSEVRIVTESLSQNERTAYQYMCNNDSLSNWY